MSLERGYLWGYQDWQFTGYSLAGITTSILCKNASVCFDVGQGLPFQYGAKRILISHSHMDHASGLPYLIAQKNMVGQMDTEIYVPENLAGPLEQIIKLWESVDGHSYSYRLRVAKPGELYELDRMYSFKPFRTVHRVQSQGYILYQKKKRLREELQGLGEEKIVEMRRRGEDPNEAYLEPAVAFTGDTQIEFIDSDPDIARAKILFVEATFWDEKKTVSHAREWGHTHLDEILGILPRLKNERIVLIHTSVRYSPSYLREILAKRLPESDRDRVVLFPRA